MKTQLTDVRGVGPSTARNLEALGIRTVATLADASAREVAAVRGFGEARAAEVIAAAGAMLNVAGARKAMTSETAPQAKNVAAAPLDENNAASDAAPSQGDGPAVAKRIKTKQEKKKKKGKKKKRKDKKKKGKKK